MDNMYERVDDFDRALRRERATFPTSKIEALLKMRPGIRRLIAALRLLPALLRMAERTLDGRWRSPSRPEPGGIVIVHASPGGFISGWYSDGKWWTRDYVPDGTHWGASVQREIHVVGWRHIEGSLAEPWHEYDEQPPLK